MLPNPDNSSAYDTPDAELDKAVQEKMHAGYDKVRVTFDYLLAEKYGKLARTPFH